MVIVGGGVAGMVAALELARSGRHVVVLEAGDRLGGQVRRHRLAGLDLDAGAEAFATRSSAVADLANELGLGGDLVTPEPAGAWLFSADGAANPLPATGLFGIPTAFDADLAAILGTEALARAALDDALPPEVGADADTLGELVRARMGAGVLDRLVAPVVTGVHSAHPDALAVDRVVPGLREALTREGSLARAVYSLRRAAPAGSSVAGIRGGMARLVDTLEAELVRLGVDVRLGAAADSVTPASVRVGNETVRGTVLVAAPGVLAPDRYRLAVLATLVVERPELDAAPRGSGVLVAAESSVQARALTHQTAKWRWLAEAADGLHVLRLSYSHAMPDHLDIARRDAAELLGVELAPRDIRDSSVVEWRRTVVQQPDQLSDRASGPRIPQVGEAASGTGLASVIGHARTVARHLADHRSRRDTVALEADKDKEEHAP
ncbi:MAG TPA: FAD-dependent oxidoreductase [Microbacteriaceae bacterium]|nr:FAD-dependent oxidoreductase [Microbacteriaceae bacterium]HRA09404.1 FAD-dependent oxidoreductase [Microbacteriaceae bacterium]